MGTILSGARELDASELTRRIAQAATGFEDLGIGAGDGVAMILRNDFPFFEAGMGSAALGAFPVAVNWHYTEDEARYVLEDCAAKVVVIHADLLAGLADAIPDGVKVLVVETPPEIRAAYDIADDEARVPDGAIEWDGWRSAFAPREAPAQEMPISVIYTSGTTGRPKGVVRPPFTPEAMERVTGLLAQCYGYVGVEDPSEVVTAVVGPIYHSAPNAHANFSFRAGANVILTPRFDPEELLALIERKRITHLNMVPIMFTRLLKLPREVRERYDLSSLSFVGHAAAPCPPAVKREMIEWWGPVINEYYGTTETGNVTFCTAEEWLAHPGTVGRLMPGAEVRIIDDDGNEVPPGTVGEIVARFHGIGDFTYHGDEEKRRSVDKAGLIAPGDIGYLDDDGFLYICDRVTDMIISGGVNVYPAEIEAELQQMPGVADCAVFGIPDDEFGESICAVVEPQPGHAPTEADVRAFLRGRVAGYKVPKRVEIRANLPREDSGKIFKRKLRAPYWEHAGRAI